MIRPTNNNGSCQLKWTVNGKRYSLNTGGQYGDPKARAKAQAIAGQIGLDILDGCFDQTLARYRPVQTRIPKPADLLALWDLWVASLSLSEATKADHYWQVRRMLEKAMPGLKDTAWLLESGLSDRTKSDRAKSLRACFRWAVEQGLCQDNPWLKVKVRVSRRPAQVFSLGELKAILQGFQDLAPAYYPFVLFLASTGCRLSEAIGLRWLRLDLEARTVTLADSLSIDKAGNGYRRVMKETKTGSIRVLHMPDSLTAMLARLKPCPASDNELVFRSPQGKVISAQNFRAVWRKVLDSQGVTYRKIHCLRHSALSHALAQGQPLPNVAYMAGHVDSSMVLTTYGHMIGTVTLPDLGLDSG